MTIPPPLPKGVHEARNRIIDAVMRLNYPDACALAALLQKQERDTLMAAVMPVVTSDHQRCVWMQSHESGPGVQCRLSDGHGGEHWFVHEECGELKISATGDRVTPYLHFRCDLRAGHYGQHKFVGVGNQRPTCSVIGHSGGIGGCLCRCNKPEQHEGEHAFSPLRCDFRIADPFFPDGKPNVLRCVCIADHDGLHEFRQGER